jgi:fibronectin type 3 domain-containing protein
MSSSAQTFTLSNTGNATLDIASIVFTGTNATDFSENATCGATLAPNSSCTIAVVFTPAASGGRSASLTVTDNSNGASGSTQSSTLTGTGSHDVILSWTASAASGVVGYYVYRGTAPGGESSSPLNSTPINGTSYADENVTAGVTYYYVVTAVASDGVQSAASNETEATVPTP